MKAVLCKQYGPPETLTIEDVPSLEPAEGEVIVSVHSCAANFPDTLIIEGKYQFKKPFPFVPGGEVAGTIKSVGTGVEGFARGDRVIGIPGWGGFAEETPVAASKLVRLPDAVSMDAGAALIITYGTTHYALKDRAHLQPGETMLVLGAAGGTGLAAIELGKVMGAHVIAAASTDEKLDICRRHGADETINYTDENLKDRIRDLTGGRGVDVVYDPVGGEYSEPALRGMAWNGRFLVIGFTTGEIPKLPLNLTLLKGCAVIGVFYVAFQEKEPERFRELTDELTSWLAEGRITPRITARYPLEDTARALIDLKERRATGKLIVYTERGRNGG